MIVQILKDKLLPLLIFFLSTIGGFGVAALLFGLLGDVTVDPIWPLAILGTLLSTAFFFALLYAWHRNRHKVAETAQESIFDAALNSLWRLLGRG